VFRDRSTGFAECRLTDASVRSFREAPLQCEPNPPVSPIFMLFVPADLDRISPRPAISSDEFRRAGHRLVDQLAEFLAASPIARPRRNVTKMTIVKMGALNSLRNACLSALEKKIPDISQAPVDTRSSKWTWSLVRIRCRVHSQKRSVYYSVTVKAKCKSRLSSNWRIPLSGDCLSETLCNRLASPIRRSVGS